MVQDFAEPMLGGILAQFADLHPESQLYARVVGYAGGDDPGAIQVAPIAWCGRETPAAQRVVPLAVLKKLCRVREAAVAAFERQSSGEGHICWRRRPSPPYRVAQGAAHRWAGATTMSDHDDSLRAAFAALEAERRRTWPRAQLAANVVQRRALVQRLDLRRAVKVGDTVDAIDLVDLDDAPLPFAALAADGLAVVIFFRFAQLRGGCDRAAALRSDAPARAGANRGAGDRDQPAGSRAAGGGHRGHRLNLEVLSDPDNRLARRLGLTFVPDKRPRRGPPAGSAR